MADATRRLFLIAAGDLAAAAAPAVAAQAVAPAVTLNDRERQLVASFRRMKDRRKEALESLIRCFDEAEREEERA
ncbi:hypothetical protein [Azospirillum sp. TSO22-1]|uniref:hypothetical protein n=1 Tax=Azospirillum sp. TSO22-1 TaxID=716789 RepID=UPI000D60CFA4|nr:hypothetical protein [Azospirillum sp. TSO22-1]PWC53627.1 hypothetical protein TSO221_10390 [Azospirillum sp. TSO22-1]